jgi:hypothetical protein
MRNIFGGGRRAYRAYDITDSAQLCNRASILETVFFGA